MKQITIYSTTYCPYCDRAKALLSSKDITYKEVDLTEDPKQKAELMERTGLKTVPQIFFNDELIGGFDNLSALDKAGELEKKLED